MKFANFFCRFFISAILVRFESSHFLVISLYLSFISAIASLSSLTFVSILLISSVHFSYISNTLLVSSYSLSSFTWFCLWTVMAYSFCSIFINLSSFYLATTVVLFFRELNSWSPKRAFDICSIRLTNIIKLIAWWLLWFTCEKKEGRRGRRKKRIRERGVSLKSWGRSLRRETVHSMSKRTGVKSSTVRSRIMKERIIWRLIKQTAIFHGTRLAKAKKSTPIKLTFHNPS